MSEVLTEIRFWQQVLTDAKRTVICPPDLESRCKGYVDARGLGQLITIHANPYCPPDRIFVLDEQATRAALNQDVQAYLRQPFRWMPTDTTD